MSRFTRPTLAALAMLAASAAHSGTFCDNIPWEPGQTEPIECATHHPIDPSPAPSTSTALAGASSNGTSSARANSGAEATNSLNIGGDSNRSLVAVFPPPSTAVVPQARNCIATRSTAGGFGWNLIQGATSEQYSEPLCVLQWLASSATDPAERAAVRAEIFKRLGEVK